MDPTLKLIGNIVLLSSLIPLIGFLAFYGFRSRWRESPFGRNLLLQKAGFAAVILVVLSALFFGDYPGREIVRLVIYAVIVVTLWVDFIQLLNAQREDRRKRGGH